MEKENGGEKGRGEQGRRRDRRGGRGRSEQRGEKKKGPFRLLVLHEARKKTNNFLYFTFSCHSAL